MVESELKENMVKTMEAEQRSKLLSNLLKMGLVTKEVRFSMENQRKQKKMNDSGRNVYSKTGGNQMKEKIRDRDRKSVV